MAALEITLAVLTLIVGLVFAYLGWGLYTTLLRLLGAFVGGGFGLMVYRSGVGSELWHALLLIVIGAIIGALIAVFAQRIFVAFAGLFLGISLGNMATQGTPFEFGGGAGGIIPIALGIVIAILFFVFFQIGVMVATAAIGALYVANAGIVLLRETDFAAEIGTQLLFWGLLLLVGITGFLRQRSSYGTG
ncbi:MAG: hypothetical protein KY455_01580 [Euryarchaeota archaeon]|nr:hypothetical protein [Euryarchaeota archaeon]